MGDAVESDDRDGLRTLTQKYDIYVPRFEVYVGPDDTDPANGEEILTPEDAIEREKNRINGRIFKQTTTTSRPTAQQLVPLTGAFRSDPGKRTNDVRSVELTESVGPEGQLTQVRVEVHNVYDPRTQRYLYTDRVEDDDFYPILDTGKALALRMGYRDAIEPVFEGLITEVQVDFPADGEPTASVTAVDKRDRLRAQRPRQSEGVSPGSSEEALAAKLVSLGRLSLAARQTTPLSGSVRVPRDQDLSAFITDRARRAALELGAFGNVVFLLSPGDRKPPSLRYRYREGLISFKPTFNATACPTEVVVRARTSRGERFSDVRADADTLAAAGMVPAATQGETALRALASEEAGGGQRTMRITDVVFTGRDEAQQYANAVLKYHIDRLFTAHGELLGDPRIRAGMSIEIAGVGRYDGAYYVTSVTHSFGDGGYQTSFDARRNTLPHQQSERTGGSE